MNIGVLGLGYVGCVTAAWLCDFGHTVYTYDPQKHKRELAARSYSPVVEPGIDEKFHVANREGRLIVVDQEQAILDKTEMAMVCVSTDSLPDGHVDLSAVQRVMRAFQRAPAGYVIVYRSTLYPGTMRDLVSAALDAGELSPSVNVVTLPEFTREGTALQDQLEQIHVAGTASGMADAKVMVLFEQMGLLLSWTTWENTELLKHACNAFHALKVAFANEIDQLARSVEAEGQVVMDYFMRDTRLNCSKAYLRPGLPFGGSCLPKDVRALTKLTSPLEYPVLHSILPSNQVRHDWLFGEVVKGQSIGLVGITFKAGTDDVRESPMVELGERLLKADREVRVYDPSVGTTLLTRLAPWQVDNYLSTLVEACDTLVLSQWPSEALKFWSVMSKKRIFNFTLRALC